MTIIRKTLRTYRFIDKDPVKDELQTILQDTGLFDRLDIVADLSNCAKATLIALFHGDTRRPQNATVMGIVTAVGYERKFVRARKLNVEKELEFARAWNKRERKRLEAARAKQRPARKRKSKSKKRAA